MKKEYDFSKGVRVSVLPATSGKTRITIRIDDGILNWFRAQVHDLEGGYQTMINSALQEYIKQRKQPLEDILRRVLREELRNTA